MCPGTLRGSPGRFYRCLRLELTACSWLFSSPLITAGNVIKKVAPCPAMLFTKTRPPCIPTMSYTPDRLMALESVPCAGDFEIVLKGRSNILLRVSGGISAVSYTHLRAQE